MIPKILHYCWFGDRPLCELSKKCMASWEKYCPDYEIRFWNEDNIDLSHPFIAHYIAEKKWAFVSDFVRLQKIKEFGGIYLDTDFEVIRSLDPLLSHSCFLGEEKPERVNSGIIGAHPNHPFVDTCLELMLDRFENSKPYWIAPEICTKALEQTSEGVSVFPPKAFYPFNPYNEVPGNDRLMFSDIEEETFAIHHWAKSWKMPLHQRILRKIDRLTSATILQR